jgi:hypothetical protein
VVSTSDGGCLALKCAFMASTPSPRRLIASRQLAFARTGFYAPLRLETRMANASFSSRRWMSVLLLRGMTYFRNFWGTFWFPPRSGRKLSFTSVVRSATRAGVLALLTPLRCSGTLARQARCRARICASSSRTLVRRTKIRETQAPVPLVPSSPRKYHRPCHCNKGECCRYAR